MNDPFSIGIRQYIPWTKYRILEDVAALGSLIGQIDVSPELVAGRIADLVSQENRCGFVYLGERNWLEAKLLRPKLNYSTWAWDQLACVFDGDIEWEVNEEVGLCWRGATENFNQFWVPNQLSNNCTIQLESVVELVVPAEKAMPADHKICQGFQILHNLQYFLSVASVHYSEMVYLEEIIVRPEDERWRIDLHYDYGSVGSVEFTGRDLAKAGPTEL